MKIVPDFEDDKYCTHVCHQMSREKAKPKFGVVFVSGKKYTYSGYPHKKL